MRITIAVALAVIFTTLHIGFVNAGLLISAAYVGQFIGAWVFGYLSETLWPEIRLHRLASRSSAS